MTTVLIDYDSGNLHSAEKAFQRMAAEVGAGPVIVTADPEVCGQRRPHRAARRRRIPGLPPALTARSGLYEAMVEAVDGTGRPFLGICVGMQMMATRAWNTKRRRALIGSPATVDRIAPADPALKVPHMGWNDLVIDHPHPVLDGIKTGDHAYFVHSYQMQVDDRAQMLAHCDYGGPVTAVVGTGNRIGTQFHPEKSQAAGLRLIANFLRWRP